MRASFSSILSTTLALLRGILPQTRKKNFSKKTGANSFASTLELEHTDLVHFGRLKIFAARSLPQELRDAFTFPKTAFNTGDTE